VCLAAAVFVALPRVAAAETVRRGYPDLRPPGQVTAQKHRLPSQSSYHSKRPPPGVAGPKHEPARAALGGVAPPDGRAVPQYDVRGANTLGRRRNGVVSDRRAADRIAGVCHAPTSIAGPTNRIEATPLSTVLPLQIKHADREAAIRPLRGGSQKCGWAVHRFRIGRGPLIVGAGDCALVSQSGIRRPATITMRTRNFVPSERVEPRSGTRGSADERQRSPGVSRDGGRLPLRDGRPRPRRGGERLITRLRPGTVTGRERGQLCGC